MATIQSLRFPILFFHLHFLIGALHNPFLSILVLSIKKFGHSPSLKIVSGPYFRVSPFLSGSTAYPDGVHIPGNNRGGP